jgi:hypothetical protein
MKKIAIFGTSWSDPFYDGKTMDLPTRNKTWTEFLLKYRDDIEIWNFAMGGGSNDLMITMLSSLCLSRQTEYLDWDLIIYEIPPLSRSWYPIDMDDGVLWDMDTGFPNFTIGSNKERRFMIEKYHETMDKNHRCLSGFGIDDFHCAPVGIFSLENKERPIDNPWIDQEVIKDFLMDYGLYSLDFHINRNLSQLSSLENIRKMLNTKLVTMSWSEINWGERPDYTKMLSGGTYPSNIDLYDVLEKYAEIHPREIDGKLNEEWWVDMAHATGKGNQVICDEIIMKNPQFVKIFNSL